jgi:hypothetical protein
MDVRLVAALGGQAVLQSAVFVALAAALFGAAQLLREIERWNRGMAHVGTVLGALVALVVFDQVGYGREFTDHWSLGRLRMLEVLGAAIILGAYAFRPDRFAQGFAWLALGGIVGGVWILAVCLIFGGSIHALTPKYLRETIQVLMIAPFGLLWLLAFLNSSRLGWRRSLAVLVVSLLVFVSGTSLAARLPLRSSNVVVTTTEAIRSMRNSSRNFARLTRLDHLPGVAAYVGRRFSTGATPVHDDNHLSCARVGRGPVRSVLLITLDALRSDFYGVPLSERHNLERFRAEALDFTHAMQATSGTVGSLFSMRTGRYTTAASPTRDSFPELARALDLQLFEKMQKWGGSPEAFTREILETLQLAAASSKGFLVHAHYLALHLPDGTLRSLHQYRDKLQQLDLEFGRLLDYLVVAKLTDDTMVILTADHGEELVEERGYTSHGYGTTQTLLQTPLMIRVPGVTPGVRNDWVSGVDVFSTILDGLDARCNYRIHGHSLLGPGVPEGIRRVFSSSMAPNSAAGSRLFYSDIHSVVSAPWKLVLNRAENAVALYNLDRDPGEHHNLSDSEPARLVHLLAALDEYLAGRLVEYDAAPRHQ